MLEGSNEPPSGGLKVIAIPGILHRRHMLGLSIWFYEAGGDTHTHTHIISHSAAFAHACVMRK